MVFSPLSYNMNLLKYFPICVVVFLSAFCFGDNGDVWKQHFYRSKPIYDLTETRLREIRSQFMYWFTDRGGEDDYGDYQNNIHNSVPQLQKDLNFQLPFYGFRFDYIRISKNGYLEFSDPPPYYTYPLIFPVRQWPKENDPSFIGPFYSCMRHGAVGSDDVDQRRPGVYFRAESNLPERTDQFGVELRERLKWDIREGMVGADTFTPRHAVIATWKNMSFCGGIDNAINITNTFQVVLATDEVFTYAIFNYLDITWTSHTEAGGDTSNGENGVPAFVGFNAGNGTRAFEYNPYSQRRSIKELTKKGWVNGFNGRHIFRIDESVLLGNGNCMPDMSDLIMPLMFAPESGNMLGGSMVNISGPCFNPADRITCLFGTEEVKGIVVGVNRAICHQPMLFAEGYIGLDVDVGQRKYNWRGKYFVETPASATEKIYFEDNSVHEKAPKEIKITWDRQNVSANENAAVRISLWGYRETNSKPEIVYIDSLESSAVNLGQYIISPEVYSTRNNTDTMNIEFGFIQINSTSVIWSRPIPLAWYFGPQWERKYGTKWPQNQCDQWSEKDRNLKNFTTDLPECPCNLEQALTDKGRFSPDPECDKFANPKCMYNKGAVHCVRSGVPNIGGSEQQCCYTINGNLMLNSDWKWGSRPFRVHNFGSYPWYEPGKVPTLSQWYHDVAPFYSCCLWQDEQSSNCKTFRTVRRPSQDCTGYQPPQIAVTRSNHLVTLDNFTYTFKSKGAFSLLRMNEKELKLDVQGRFEKTANIKHNKTGNLHLTSVAARESKSAIIEVKLRRKNAQWRYRLDVFADSKRVYFDRPSKKFQHFPDVTVYTPTYIYNQSEVIIMFQSGAGLEVLENNGIMTTRVYVPAIYANKAAGLLGKHNCDVKNNEHSDSGTKLNDCHSKQTRKTLTNKWKLSNEENPLVGRTLFLRTKI